MIIFVIFLIIIIILIGIASSSSNNSETSSLDDIAKTEMMSDIYNDITGDNLDPIEKNLLFMYHQKDKKN